VVECVFLDEDRCASGDRTGGLCVWDVAGASSTPLFRAQAHRGSVTAMVAAGPAGNLLLTSGVDGMVRGWDLRGDASRPCFEAPAHAGAAAGGKGGGGKPPPPPGAVAAAAVACMVALPARGGGACSSVVTGGADSTVCLVDMRLTGGGGGGVRVLQRWAHHRVGLYSLCAAGSGDRCFFSGDGAGMMLCYDSGVAGDAALKYGVGASEQGAVRAILRVGENKVVTGSEDGKALVFSF
jgi:hypothetical protein